MSTRFDFATKLKDRGATREQAMEAFSKYREVNGAFDDDVATPDNAGALGSMNNDIMPSDPEERALSEKAIPKEDQEQMIAMRFYDRKYGVTHDNAMLQARLDIEYGDGATPEMANGFNKAPLAYVQPPTYEELLDDKSSPFTSTFFEDDVPDVAGATWRILQDVTIGTLKTSVNTAQAFMGLMDMASGTLQAPQRAMWKKLGVDAKLPSQQLKRIGYNVQKTQEEISRLYSQETQDALQKVAVQEGVLSKIGVALQNPSVVGTAIMESLGPMLLGGVVGRGFTYIPKVGIGIGEGLISAGSQLEEVLDETEGAPLTTKQKALVAATGVATALISAASSGLQSKLGLADIDAQLQRAVKVTEPKIKSPALRMALGALFEGFGEEFPQSEVETINKNLATGKPWDEGLEQSRAMAIIVGSSMGAGSNFVGPIGVKEKPTFSTGEEPFTLGSANVIRHYNNDEEIEAQVVEMPEEVQDEAREAFLNPTPEKVAKLNEKLKELNEEIDTTDLEPTPMQEILTPADEVSDINDPEVDAPPAGEAEGGLPQKTAWISHLKNQAEASTDEEATAKLNDMADELDAKPIGDVFTLEDGTTYRKVDQDEWNLVTPQAPTSEQTQEATADTPVAEETPVAEDAPEEVEDVALTHAEVETIRGEATSRTKQTWEQTAKRAKNMQAQGILADTLSIAKSIIEQGRPASAEEHVLLALETGRKLRQKQKLSETILRLIGNGQDATVQIGQLSAIEQQLDALELAGDMSGTATGRSLNIRKMRSKQIKYDMESVLQRAEIERGAPLTKKQKEEVAEAVKGFEEAQAELNEAVDAVKRDLAKKFTAKRKGIKDAEPMDDATLLAYIETINEQLAETGELTPEVAKLVAKLAENAIIEGAQTLEEVVLSVQAGVPNLSDKMIYDAMGGRIVQEQESKSTLRKLIAKLKKEGRVTGQVMDAINNVFDPNRVTEPTPAEIKALQESLKILKAKAKKFEGSTERAREIYEAVAEIERLTQIGARKIKPDSLVVTQEILDAKAALAEALKYQKLIDDIADADEQLSTGRFKSRFTPKLNKLESKRVEDAKAQLHAKQTQIDEIVRKTKQSTIKGVLRDVYDIPRTLLLSIDIGHLMRQGALPLSDIRKIGMIKTIWGKSFAALLSQKSANEVARMIKEHPSYVAAVEAGVPFIKEGGEVNGRERVIQNDLIEGVPVLGIPFKASARSQVQGVNLIRLLTFDFLYQNHPEMTKEELRQWAEVVGIMSGSGKVNAGFANFMDNFLTSTKFAASRIQALTMLPKYWNNKHVRNEIISDSTQFLMSRIVIMYLLTRLVPDEWEIGMNPKHHTFGKFLVNLDGKKTRIYDPWAGLQQMVRFTSALGMFVATRGEEGKGLSQAIMDLGRSRAHPAISLAGRAITNKTMFGDDVEKAIDHVYMSLPLSVQSAIEATGEDTGLADAVTATVLDIVGLNSYLIDDSEVRGETKWRDRK